MITIIKAKISTYLDDENKLAQKKQEILDEYRTAQKEERPMVIASDLKWDIELYADYSDGISVDATR